MIARFFFATAAFTIALLAMTGSALALTVERSLDHPVFPGLARFHVVDSGAEVNTLTVTAEPIPDTSDSDLVFSDSTSPITPGTGCVAIDANSVRCSGTGAIWIELGGESDTTQFGDPFYGNNIQGSYIYGGPGDDVLGGRKLCDVFVGGPGADQMAHDGGASICDEVSYSDRSAAVTVDNDGIADDGQPGENDVIGPGVSAVTGGSGDDIISGYYQASGGGGADQLSGPLASNSVLYGGGGDDQLTTFDGNDTIYPGDGNDTVDAGLGFTDHVSYASESAGTHIRLDGIAATESPGNNDTIVNVERATGGAGADHLVGTSGVDHLDGGAGADLLEGGVGSDTFVGTGIDTFKPGTVVEGGLVTTDGNDEYYLVPEDEWPTIDLTDTTAPLSIPADEGFGGGSATVDRFVLRTGSGNDEVDCYTARLDWHGGSGNDTANVCGHASLDDLPNDQLSLYAADSNIRSDVENLTQTATSARYTLTGNSQANVLKGAEAGDALSGAGGSDTLIGLAGPDILNGGEGPDVIDGNSNDANGDTIDYSMRSAGVSFSDDGIANDGESGEADNVLGVEIVKGSSVDDEFHLTSSMIQIDGGTGFDSASYASAATGLDGAGVHISVEQIDGSNFDDLLVVQNGDFAFAGAGGNDTLKVEAPTPSDSIDFTGGAGLDEIVYMQSSGETEISLDGLADDGNYPGGVNNFGSDVEFVTTGGADDLVIGNAADNVLELGPGTNASAGLAGLDTVLLRGAEIWPYGVSVVVGEVGWDQYISDDIEIIIGTDWRDNIKAGPSGQLIDGRDGDDVLIGSTGVDALFGGGDADYLDGGLESDYLDGEPGWDTVSYDDRTSPLAISLDDQQNDGQAGELDQIVGVEEVYGGQGNDTILGTDDSDKLWGAAGNDLLDGRGGNDTLVGDTGSDTLRGMDGDDQLHSEDGANDTTYCGSGFDQAYEDSIDTLWDCESTLTSGIAKPTPSPTAPQPTAPTPRPTPPTLTFKLGKTPKLAAALKGFATTVSCAEGCTVEGQFTITAKQARQLGFDKKAVGPVVVGSSKIVTRPGKPAKLTLRFTKLAKSRLKKVKSVKLVLTFYAWRAGSTNTEKKTNVTLKR